MCESGGCIQHGGIWVCEGYPQTTPVLTHNTSIVTSNVNAGNRDLVSLQLLTMCLITTVKTAFKDIVKTGRIHKQKWLIHDPVPILSRVYFKNGTFTVTHRNGMQFELPLSSFTVLYWRSCHASIKGSLRPNPWTPLASGLRHSCASFGTSSN